MSLINPLIISLICFIDDLTQKPSVRELPRKHEIPFFRIVSTHSPLKNKERSKERGRVWAKKKKKSIKKDTLLKKAMMICHVNRKDEQDFYFTSANNTTRSLGRKRSTKSGALSTKKGKRILQLSDHNSSFSTHLSLGSS